MQTKMLLVYLNLIMLTALLSKTFTASSRLESIKELSQKEAAEHCAMRGNILWEYSDLTENSEAIEYLNDLDNGQSAWIEGRAIFSPFLNWIGCFKNDNSLRQYEFNTFQVEKENMLYVCQRKCKYYSHGFIGVTVQSCFCFPWLLDLLSRVSVSACSRRCSNFSFESCGGQNSLSLYQRDRGRFSRRPRPSAGQCLYIYAPNSASLVSEPRAISCLSSPHAIMHYICVQKTAPNCSKFADSGDYCTFIKTSASWLDAIEDCQTRSSYLLFDVDTIFLSNVRSVLRSCKTCNYIWLGVYRTFLPTDKTDRLQDPNACLSVRKVGESFYIETDNCWARKTFRCKQISSENSAVYNSSRNNKDKNTTARTVHTGNVTAQDTATVSTFPSSVPSSRKSRRSSVSHTIMPTSLTRSVNRSVDNNETLRSNNSQTIQIGLVTALALNGIVILVVAVFCLKYRTNRRQQRLVASTLYRAHEPDVYASGDLRFGHTDAHVTPDLYNHEYASIDELQDELSISNERSLPTHDSAHLYEEFMTSNDRYTYTDLEAADACQHHQKQQEDTTK